MADVTIFEMLPDEMILHICRYFRCGEILYSFFNLNARLNLTITEFCHYVNLRFIAYKQFNFVAMQIVPQIGQLVRSFLVNGEWETITRNKINLKFFYSKLSLLFPQLHTLTLVNFTGKQLIIFLDKITDLIQLVKLNIANLYGEHEEDLLSKILAANNNRIKAVLFNSDSIDFNLTPSGNDKVVSYPNIEELTVNLNTDKTLEYLFTIVPNINRLHIDFNNLSSDSKSALVNVSSLIHLKDFQLLSMNISWSLDEIAHILSKMPHLERLVLDLITNDEHLVNGQNLIRVLPSLHIEIHLFIIYGYLNSHIEIDALLSTWPTHIRITCLHNESDKYAIIHTIPYILPSIVIPGKIANYMLSGSEYTRKVKDLRIYAEQCSTDIHLIVQHFHQLRKLTIGPEENSQALTSQSIQSIVLHLPQLKSLHVKGMCDISRIVQVASNLEHLKIDFNCLNNALDTVSICELLQQRIVNLEITNLEETDSTHLNSIALKLNRIYDLSLSMESPTVLIDSLILKVLSLWKEKNLRGLYIRGLLTDEMSKNLYQWFIDHTHLREDDSFVVQYKIDWLSIWLR